MEKELLLYRNMGNGIEIPFPNEKDLFHNNNVTPENPILLENPSQGNIEETIITNIYCDLVAGREYEFTAEANIPFALTWKEGVEYYLLKDKNSDIRIGISSIGGKKTDSMPEIEFDRIVDGNKVTARFIPVVSGRYYLRVDNNQDNSIAEYYNFRIVEKTYYSQVSLTSFTYNAQRMAATPTITASFNYPRCLDNDWDVNVYATYRGERYYIRQIPSSSKDNKSVMYKHDITLYSERFVLENIYLYDVLKNDDTNVIIRCDLKDFTDVINRSLVKSKLPYSVSIDDSVANTEKALEVKDIALDKVYLSVALQEIYNQWGIPYYFDGHNIIVKDHSKWIADTVLEYGYDKSLLSIKKDNANFRKITRCSGYGSDKNIPFFYPNLSQKGIIDLEPLEGNKLLQKSDFIITDMRKFDKQMPLNGNVIYKSKDNNTPSIDFFNGGIEFNNVKKEEVKNIRLDFSTERDSIYATFSFVITIKEDFYISPNSNYNQNAKVTINWMFDTERELPELLMPLIDIRYTAQSSGGSDVITSVVYETISKDIKTTKDDVGGKFSYNITRQIKITLSAFLSKEHKFLNKKNKSYTSNVSITLKNSEAVEKKELVAKDVKIITALYVLSEAGIIAKNKGYNSFIQVPLNTINASYGDENVYTDEGWYLNNTKKIKLSDIGIKYLKTENDTISGEGFKQIMVSKIPTATNLMPPLYRNTLGNEKFYNAKDNTYLNDDNEYYDFETEWNEVNQNEHIQPFEDIYPTITNIVNADNVHFDEVLDVAFDDNDNNEVDEEGNFLHPYFYVKIPIFSGDFGFNLFDHKIVGGNMQVSFTSGDCSACVFDIMVKTRPNANNETYEDVINPIKLQNGTLVSGDWQQKTAGNFGSEDTTQQNSETNSIWLVLKKDDQTFGTTLPDKIGSVIPKKGDKFVLLNIEMPQKYIDSAEELLRKNIIQYMWENNSDKWNFTIDFSRIFLQENPIFVDDLSENAKVRVKYDGIIYDFYVNDYKYVVKSNEALPKITIGLVDTITINRGIAQAIANGVMQGLQSQLGGVAYLGELDEMYLRKRYDETMPNNMTFKKDVNVEGTLYPKKTITNNLQSDNYSGEELSDTGFQLHVDKGVSSLVLDRLKVRKKLEVFEYIVNQLKAQAGTLWVTSASMECSNIEVYDNYYRCYFDTKNGSIYNQFEINDLAICRIYGNNSKYYWRKVVEVGLDYIDLSIEECDYNSDIPEKGDIIIQLGNTTNIKRQSAIELSSNENNSPSFIMYSGIDTFSLVNKETTGIEYKPDTYKEDENGNIIKVSDGYPNFFSFGSMYFGLRNGENNFISFQKNEETGNFEMIINAKTKFKGDVLDISDILEETSNRVDNMEFLTEALQGSTDILGGLVLTNVLEVKNILNKVTGGINGLKDDDNNLFLWAGGSAQDAKDMKLPFVINHDGTGKIGNLFINKNSVSVMLKDYLGNHKGWLHIQESGFKMEDGSGNTNVYFTVEDSQDFNNIGEEIQSVTSSHLSTSKEYFTDYGVGSTNIVADDLLQNISYISAESKYTNFKVKIKNVKLYMQHRSSDDSIWQQGHLAISDSFTLIIGTESGAKQSVTWDDFGNIKYDGRAYYYNLSEEKELEFSNIYKKPDYIRIKGFDVYAKATGETDQVIVKFEVSIDITFEVNKHITIIAKNGIAHMHDNQRYMAYYHDSNGSTHFKVNADEVEIKQNGNIILNN